MQNELKIDIVKEICSKKSIERTTQDILFLTELTKSVKVFKDLINSKGTSAHSLCCRFLKYQHGDEGEYLFRYGDIGTRFYVIVQGKVAVEVPMRSIKGNTHFVEILLLSSGSAFGELALESSKPRAASIKCKVSSHFIYLEKCDYDKLISKIVYEERIQLIDFLHSLPIFRKFTKGALSKLTYIFKEKVYFKGQAIYSEGELAEEAYIIREGELEVLKVIQGSKTSKNFFKKTSNKIKKIAVLGPGEMLGEEEILNESARLSSCKSLSAQCKLLSFSKFVFSN